MTDPRDDDFGGLSLFELFAQETDAQARLLSDGLLKLERQPDDGAVLESCMRAAHSLKGAARIVGVAPGVAVAHAAEECFVLAQRRRITLGAADIDTLLRAVDVLRSIAETVETADQSVAVPSDASQQVVIALETICGRGLAPMPAPAAMGPAAAAMPLAGTPLANATTTDAPLADAQSTDAPLADTQSTDAPLAETRSTDASLADARSTDAPVTDAPRGDIPSPAAPRPPPFSPPPLAGAVAPDPWAGSVSADGSAARTLRVAAENVDRLLALSGQAVVEARTLRRFTTSLVAVQRRQREAGLALQRLRTSAVDVRLPDVIRAALDDATSQVEQVADQLAERSGVLEDFARRQRGLSNQLYEVALASRMRPFGDITGGYPRMIREVARGLGKQVRLTIEGAQTPVDRDILALLDAPLGHLLRNAVDHGIETAEARRAAGKPAEGRITIEAHHVAGALAIDIDDDGAGVDIEAVRAAAVRRGLANDAAAARLSDAELLDLLMLPGFSLREQVTPVSGRGVGLDVVQTAVRQVRGTVRIVQQRGVGCHFKLQLPLTLSVLRCLLADVGGEPYALPLARIHRALRVPRETVETVEGRSYFRFDGRIVALVQASSLFGLPQAAAAAALSVIVLDSVGAVVSANDGGATYGLIVDQFRDERMLVLQPLDPRLGKVENIAAASLMEDGAPVLIVDVDSLLRDMPRYVADAGPASTARADTDANADASLGRRKRILIVDDSLTVRELQRKLLTNGGYAVSVAVDGLEGWDAVRAERFDMVVTDVDMPRCDGIELLAMIRRDPALRTLPVIIVSYKDRPTDRQRGLDAGADQYLAKSGFDDLALLDAVRELIGDANE